MPPIVIVFLSLLPAATTQPASAPDEIDWPRLARAVRKVEQGPLHNPGNMTWAAMKDCEEKFGVVVDPRDLAQCLRVYCGGWLKQTGKPIIEYYVAFCWNAGGPALTRGVWETKYCDYARRVWNLYQQGDAP